MITADYTCTQYNYKRTTFISTKKHLTPYQKLSEARTFSIEGKEGNTAKIFMTI